MTKNDLFKEGMEFLLISAMYRGYCNRRFFW
jgi:hypothetical protein